MSDKLEYKFRLVVFLGNKKGKKEIIDIVPTDWIYSDEKFDDLRCKFMPEKLYNGKNLELLNEMIRKCAEPCKSWPSYSIEIRGRARSYEEAEKLINKLQYQPYAYSTDNEMNNEAKAKYDKELFKVKKFSSNKIDDILENVTLDLATDPQINYDGDMEIIEDNSEQRTVRSSPKKFKNNKDGKIKRWSARTQKSLGSKRKRTSSQEDSSELDKSTDSSGSEDNNALSKYSKVEKSNVQCSNDTEPLKQYVDEELLMKTLTKLLEPVIEKQKRNNDQLNSICKSLNDLKGLIINIQRICESNIGSTQIEFDSEDETLKLPCSNLNNFNIFNNKIQDDESYRNKIARKLTVLANPNQALIRSTVPMMRLVMSRELALQFNLKKPSEKKTNIFMDTQFYKLIKGVLVKKFSKSVDDPLPNAVINESISSVLNHCMDWDGGRTERKKKSSMSTTVVTV